MSPINPLLNQICNQIHRLSAPEQHPLTRMFSTRLANIPCAITEGVLIVLKSLELCAHCARHTYSQDIPTRWNELIKLIEGLASTLFLGIVFSPEANFKMHIKLNLVVDFSAGKSQKDLANKLAELQKAEIANERNQRFAQLETEQTAGDATSDHETIHSRLKELMSS